MFQFLFLLIFSSYQLLKLKSSIASIMSEIREAPDAHLKPCKTSMNIFFSKIVT